MSAILNLASAALIATGSLAEGRPPSRYLELVNRANDSLIAFATAPSGSEAFHARSLATPLPGGGTAITVEVASETCRLDFRFTFRTGRRVIYRDIDICHNRALRIQRLPREGGPA